MSFVVGRMNHRGHEGNFTQRTQMRFIYGKGIDRRKTQTRMSVLYWRQFLSIFLYEGRKKNTDRNVCAILIPIMSHKSHSSHKSQNTRSGDTVATERVMICCEEKLTTEDTKRRIHKGHGGVYNYGMGMK